MFRKISYFFLTLALILSCVTAYAVWKNTLPLVSPIALIEVITGNAPAAKSSKIVYGFLPYWNTKYSESLHIDSLTHLAYFAVDLNPDGSIHKVDNRVEQEPGWIKLHSQSISKLFYQSKLLGQKLVLVVTAMEPELIQSLSENPLNSINAVKSIMAVYQDKKFDDINVDFEFVGEPNRKTREGFTAFVQSLKSACISVNQKCQITVDIFGDTAEKYRLWDLAALSPFTDHFIVMAYDYHRKSSTVAGPVAPLTGKCITKTVTDNTCLNQDIITHISQMAKIVPAEKIILGIPFYGYEWQTASEIFMANTYKGTGALATYSRIQTLLTDPEISSLSAKWSESSLSPYIVYQKDGDIYQIQYENSRSIDQKIKLVNSAGLGGVAIWALGYETPHTDLWRSIDVMSNN